jgi:hypothetical protein
MNFIDTLKAQHDELEELFHDMGVARGAELRARIFDELSDTLVAHIGLEERLLRVAVARAPRSSGLLEVWDARLRVERVMTLLAAMDVQSETFQAQLERLQDLIEERVEHEELYVFPRLERYLGVAKRPPTARPAQSEAHAA